MINIKQESDLWIVEVKEFWTVKNSDDQAELTNFLQDNKLPYSVGYSVDPADDTALIFGLNIGRKQFIEFATLKDVVDKLLVFKYKFVIPRMIGKHN